MARDRLSVILDGMALKKDLKAAHYKVYLSLFSAIQKGTKESKKTLQLATGMTLRTVQRTIKELAATGNLKEGKDGFLSITFWSGLPAKVQENEAEKATQMSRSDAESQSIYLREDIRNKIYELSNMIHISYNEVLSSLKLRAISSISDSKSRMRVDLRFQELVDRLFKTFEKVFKEKMNPLWGKSDGAMVKRMLLSLPEEGVDRLVSSFENFLHTTDPFEIEQVKNKPVRYWATRVTKYLPAKQFDVVAAAKAQQRRSREKKND